ncbi:MAG: M48 family metallopeptidase [Schleiferiaceae bacterium]|nr:M48 family metallopeptidase [Schleiferiaceae bacterium]
MLKHLSLAIFILIGWAKQPFAQTHFDHYKPMVSIGEIPTDFQSFYAEKTKSALDELAGKRGKDRRLEKTFHYENQYFMERTLNSGNVLFGDDVTRYVQKVLDKVLAMYGETNKDIRVYSVRSPVFNAAATHDGVLFVNLGLMAQIENEAQLAFILAHEIIHSEENHAIDGYKEKSRIRNENILRSNNDEKLVALSTYSKNLEFEADVEAFKRFFSKSGYDYREVLRVMDVMLYSYLPFDEVPFPNDFFNSGSFVLEPALLPSTVNPITAIEDFNDSLTTHPNLRERKKALEKEFENLNEAPTNKLFLVDEPGFFHAQTMARFELCRIYLSRRRYADAIYNAFILMQDYPNNEYLRQIIGSALSSMAVYKNLDYDKFLEDFTTVEGNKMTISSLLKMIEPSDMNRLAVRYNYELHRDFPNNEEAKALFEHALNEMILFQEPANDYFLRELFVLEEQEEEEQEEEEEEVVSRRGRSRKVTALKKQSEMKQDLERYSFADLFVNDPAFTTAFDAALQSFEDAKDQKDYVSLKDQREKMKKASTKGSKKKNMQELEAKRREKNPPVEKVVVVNPIAIADAAKPYPSQTGRIYFMNHQNTGKQQIIFRDVLEKALQESGLDYEMLDIKRAESVDDFNAYVTIQAWLNEFWLHPLEENRVSEMANIKGFIETYGTPYVLLVAQEVTDISSFGFTNMIYKWPSVFGFVFPVMLPFTANALLTTTEVTNHLVLVNIETGSVRTVRKDVGFPSRKISRANIIHGHLYDIKNAK